jgi:hypothetical protein
VLDKRRNGSRCRLYHGKIRNAPDRYLPKVVQLATNGIKECLVP